MLAKIEIQRLDDGSKPFQVMFNPNSYAIVKPITWKGLANCKQNAPTLTFQGGGSRTLTLNLFYDVTESVDGVPVDDVRKKTNNIVALTQIPPGKSAPPAVQVSWGGTPPPGSDFPFTGVVTRLTQTFKLFSSDGKPLRAELAVELTEYVEAGNRQAAGPKASTQQVKQGDTLSGIAAQNGCAPADWRRIAEANNLDDPRKLPPGLRLSIPGRG